MKIKRWNYSKKETYIISAVILFLIGINIWSYYTGKIYRTLKQTREEYAISTSTLENTITGLKNSILNLKVENQNLNSVLNDEQRRRLALEDLKAQNEKKIDTLTKLTTLDPELLKKYSKVYFLSENYKPPQLANVATTSLSDTEKGVQLIPQVYSYLARMIDDTNRIGLPLKIISGYRSFEYQKTLKSDYKVIYGAGTANQFSAEQGYSEHQLGTTLDITAPALKSPEISFENTALFSWLNENAYKYGFILSYPRSNKYYQYEPWHWRFVGVELATKLHNDKKYFYEMDQREIDQYLIKIFD